jgi:hypothetical protein
VVAGGVGGALIGSALGQQRDNQLNRPFYGNPNFHHSPQPFYHGHPQNPGYYYQPAPIQPQYYSPQPMYPQPVRPALPNQWPSSLNQGSPQQEFLPLTPQQSSPSPIVTQSDHFERSTPRTQSAERKKPKATQSNTPAAASRLTFNNQLPDNRQATNQLQINQPSESQLGASTRQGSVQTGNVQSGKTLPSTRTPHSRNDSILVLPPPSTSPNVPYQLPYRHGW